MIKISATLSLATTGSHIGWTSPTLPYLKSKQSHLKVTSDNASWIASFYLLGSIPGNLIAAFVVDRYGRKTCLLASSLPLFIGWLLIIIAWNPYILFASRFISGLGQGVVYVVCPVYICEIADKKIRGRLGSFIKLMVTLGELYAHAIGPFVSYNSLAFSCAIIPVLFFVSFIWMPESPYYLLMKNNRVSASKSLRRLERYYQSEEEIEESLDQMAKVVIKDMNDKGHFWDLFDTNGNRKAVMISFGLQVILQFSGIAAIESYTQEIIGESESGLSPGISVIILSILQLVSGLGAAALVDKLGRRPLLICTTFLAGISLTISGIFYLVKHYFQVEIGNFGWVLVVSIIFYELIIALGLSPLPYLMLGELFPTNVKGVAVSIVNLWASLLAFIVSKMYQVVADNLGIYVSFFWFAASCFLGIVFIYYFVPETSTKSLLEIQEELNCGRKMRKIKEEKKSIDQSAVQDLDVSNV